MEHGGIALFKISKTISPVLFVFSHFIKVYNENLVKSTDIGQKKLVQISQKLQDEAEFYQKYVSHSDANFEASLNLLGLVLMLLNRCDEAEIYFQKAIQIKRMSDFSYGNLGSLYAQLRKKTEADEALKMAVNFNS